MSIEPDAPECRVLGHLWQPDPRRPDEWHGVVRVQFRVCSRCGATSRHYWDWPEEIDDDVLD